jgi:Ser/Thr protein kinase RdoA (MazF antagonist)
MPADESTEFFDLDPHVQVQRLIAAGHEVLQDWDIHDAEISPIKYRENAVFRVEHACGRCALRMHRTGYHSDAELYSELQWMQALDEAGVSVPIVVPTTSGDMFASLQGEGLPGVIQTDLFEWIDGEQLASVEEGIADESSVQGLFGTIGEIAARVHNQASDWMLPGGFMRHAWDAEGLAGDNPFWGRFWELANASKSESLLMLRAKKVIFEELERFPQTRDTYSMIHADLSLENLMVDGDIVRLIDFDDAGFGWHLFEIATSLYFVRSESFYEQALESLIAGYREYRPLSDEHLESLPLFYLARAMTNVGWVHTRQETETAQELTPMLLGMACELAEEYLTESNH